MKDQFRTGYRRVDTPLRSPMDQRAPRRRFRRRGVLVASTRLPFTLTPAAHG